MATDGCCDGADNNCDGVIDEVLDETGSVGCVTAGFVRYADSFTNCGGCRMACDIATADQCTAGACDCASEPGLGPAKRRVHVRITAKTATNRSLTPAPCDAPRGTPDARL